MQPKDTQESPSSNQSGTPTQHMFESSVPLQTDQLISGDNEKVYAFHHNQRHLSLKQRFGLLSRTRQVLLVVGSVSVVFIVSMVVLTFVMYEPPRKSSTTIVTKSSAVTEDLNNDGVVDTEDAKVAAGDANKDGVVDDKDLAFVEADLNSDGVVDEEDTIAVTDEEIAWWQELIGKIKGVEEESAGEDEYSYEYEADPDPDPNETVDVDEDYTGGIELPQDILNGTSIDETDVEEVISAPNIAGTTGTPVTIATWNVLKYDNNTANVRAGVKDIFSAGATAIGLQELSSPSFTANSVRSLASSSVGVYSPGGGNAIVWNNKLIEKITANSFAPVNGNSKRFTNIKFRYRSTRQEFYVVNVHMQTGTGGASESCSSTICRLYKAQMKALVTKLRQLQSAKIPIILVGDFNVDYRDDNDCKITWHPCYALRKINMQSSYEALKLSSTSGSAKKYIDQAFYWTASAAPTTPVSNKILGAGAKCKTSNVRDIDGDIVIHCWNGSDHKPILFTAKLAEN